MVPLFSVLLSLPQDASFPSPISPPRLTIQSRNHRRLDVRNTHVGADGLGSVLKILSLRAPSPSSSSSFPATTPNSPPLGTLRHLYVSLMHGKDEERQLETVQALLLQVNRRE